MNTGGVASASQRAGINTTGNTLSLIGNGEVKFACKISQNSAAWFDGTTTGAFRIGFGDSATAESANAIYFRASNSNILEFVCRSSNVETVRSTGITLSNGTFHTLEFTISSDGATITPKVNGSTLTTITTNIPSARLFILAHVLRVAAIGTSVSAAIDYMYFKFTPNTSFF
jgi:hypothetical protein